MRVSLAISEHRARRNGDALAGCDELARCRIKRLFLKNERFRSVALIDKHFFRGQALSEFNALFHRLSHLFVIQGVARSIDQATPIGDRHTTPGIE